LFYNVTVFTHQLLVEQEKTVMNLSTTRNLFNSSFQTIRKTRVRSGSVYSFIIILSMIAFEAFNYGTTAYALRDLLGDLRFAGFQWATLMALAFCALDFAGIATLITQGGRSKDHHQAWYLFGAWLIAGTFNAALTWWGVSIAISNHTTASAAIVSTQSLTTVVPVFVAVMVWIIRILIIGSLSSVLERNSQASRVTRVSSRNTQSRRANPVSTPTRPTVEYNRPLPSNRPSASIAARPQQDPTYHSLNAQARRK
jgi:hypothetical protein